MSGQVGPFRARNGLYALSSSRVEGDLLVTDTLRINENGSGLRMTNIGAFDNASGNFRIFSNGDLILSTNGDSGTAVTFDQTTKGANFVGAVTGSALQLASLGSQNEIIIVGANKAVTSSDLLSIDTTNDRIGIGTSSPEVKLHINGDAANEAQIRLEQHNNTADAPDIRIRRSRGTTASPTTLSANDYMFRLNIDVYDGSGYVTAGMLRWDNDGTTNNNGTNNVFGLQTRVSGTTADRLNVISTGAVRFNNAYTFPTSDGSNGQVLTTNGSGQLSFSTVSGGGTVDTSGTPANNQVAVFTDADTIEGHNKFLYDSTTEQVTVPKIKASTSLAVGALTPSTTVGRIDAANDIVAYSTSDKRLKENVIPIENALEKVSQIRGVEFDWKELTEKEREVVHGNKGHDIGVVAQEIEQILPEAVQTRENGYKAVRYEKIVPLLIQAINELQEKLDGLTK